ncbi:dynamin family protein [Oscillospiraceae bacterium MB08-C2-2]|nr:dynamin family protein [Oscillospiraceae bacterium MB08-C2-2]
MSEATFNSFSNYNHTITALTGDLKKLGDYSRRMQLSGNLSAIEEVLKRLKEDSFNIAIVGEFNRGKSSLINALLEKDVLPTDLLPTTATLNRVTYSVTSFVQLEYHDGNMEEIEIDQLPQYVTKLTREGEQRAKSIKIATVYYPVNYCKNGVTIIDTPGLNDDTAMSDVTFSVLPQADAAIMVMMAGAPFSQSEYEFLENKIITSDLGRVLFVLTGIDLYSDSDVERLLSFIRQKITESVLNKAQKVHGKGSEEYMAIERKLGTVRIYGLSAKNALKAKKKGDHAALEKSGFPVFETALERFLTEDRGAIRLNVPISRIKTSSVELMRAVRLRENALAMEREEFDAQYAKAMNEIQSIRNEREAEFRGINHASENAYATLLPIIEEYWPGMEQAADNAIDEYVISDVKELEGAAGDATQEAMTKAVKGAMAKASQNFGERIQASINRSLQNEAERVSDFERRFFEATESIQNMFIPKSKDSSSESDIVISTLADGFLLFGLGGAYQGFRQAGWKGALLGGATSAATGIAASFTSGLLISALSLPLTWPVVLVAGLGAALAGALMGKWALGKVFAKDKIDKFKETFREAIYVEIKRMKTTDNLRQAVRGQVSEAFEALKTKIRTETENILGDTQKQLTQLKVELAHKDSEDAHTKQELRAMLEDVHAMCRRSDEIAGQLNQIMERQEMVSK